MSYPQWPSEPDRARLSGPYPPQAGHQPAAYPVAYPQSPAPFHPQPGYGPMYVPVAPSSGSAVTALVLGIVGIFAGWCMLGLPSIAAIIFGHIGLAQTKDGTKSGRGMAVAGVALGYVLVAPTIALFFLFGAGFLGLAGAAGTAP